MMEGASAARAWKGVWICAAIWLDPGLSWIEKALLAEIDCLVSEQAPCYASNEHLAQRMGVSVSRVNDMLARLQSTGFVVRVQYDGRATHRVVSPKYSSNPRNCEGVDKCWCQKAEFPETGKQTSGKQEAR
jgi:biotin operon repressor